MKGLSNEISIALNTIIDGLNYDFFKTSDEENTLLDADKMKKICESKVSSFNSAKKILDRWMTSPNSPNKETIKEYIIKVTDSGERALEILRRALGQDIDFDKLEAHKHDAAIKAKPIILESIFDLDGSIRELKDKLESDDLILNDKFFKIGYAERFGKGEFYPLGNYYKETYDEKTDSILICPKGTKGEVITIGEINITLPKKPDKSEILFSDLPKKQQYWRREEMPTGLSLNNADLYDKYIKEEFRRRREGIWFMNNGEAIYLTGHHYFALQWCKMLDNGGYMDYRHAQRNMFYHLQACVVDPRCLGQLFVKSRRTGFTYIILCMFLNDSTGTKNNNFGMTSKSDDDAKKAFIKYRYMLINLPFFFQPVVRGKLDSTKEFEFAAPLDNRREAKLSRNNNSDDYLNNYIDYQPTKNDSYDGQAMYRYLGDESSKWRNPHDYIEHFGQITPTMLEGGVVVGKAFVGSTVAAMSKGGSQFKQLYHASDVTKKNQTTGMTASGLYRYFLPAQENMTAFTDIYGVCHQEKPKESIYNVNGKPIKIGSIEYLLGQEEAKKKESDKALNEQYRAFPRTIEHAFRDEATQCVFNITKLYQQLEHNEKIPEESRYTIGNFDWKDEKDGDVVFHPNPRGRFKVAWLPSVVDGTQMFTNNIKEVNEKYYPLNDNLVKFGCDPFSLKSTHSEGSKGGIHGLTVYNPDGNAPSHKFVLEYIARPQDEVVFYEDVIKCIRFYGSPILVESNRIDLLRYMRNRGYRGFAMDRLDRPASKLNANEKEYGGQMMASKDIVDSHMNAIGSYIEKYVGESTNEEYRTIGEIGDMPFDETLRDWLAFNPDDRTKYDATISSGLAIMACQKEKYKGKVVQKDYSKMFNLFTKYDNKGNMGKPISRKINLNQGINNVQYN